MYLVYLYNIPLTVTKETSKATPHYTTTNEEHTPQHENSPTIPAIVIKSRTN